MYILKFLYFILKLYIVIDLNDGGANHIAETVKEIKKRYIKLFHFYIIIIHYFTITYRIKISCIYLIYFCRTNILVECLVPDFRGDKDCIEIIVNSNLDVFAHNIETVERLTPFVRDRRAEYR